MTTPADQPDLIVWLRAQFDEDLRGVHEWIQPREDGFLSTPLRPVHQLTDRVGAQRMLAEVDAKRRILDHCVEMLRPDSAWGGPADPESIDPGAWYVLRLLALPYADRPGYREEWRP